MKNSKIVPPHFTCMTRVLFAGSLILAGLQVYRFIYYGLHWQFLLTITTPIHLWSMFNLAFLLFMLFIPVFLLYVTRHRDVPVWIWRYVLVSILAGVARSLFLRSTPVSGSTVSGLVFQLILFIFLLWLFIRRKDRWTGYETE